MNAVFEKGLDVPEGLDAELDQVALFNALGLEQDQIQELTDVWMTCAPDVSLNKFAKVLVMQGSALARIL